MDTEALRGLAVEHSEHAFQLDVLERALADEPPDYRVVLEQLAVFDASLAEHLRREEAVLLPWLSSVLPDRLPEIELLVREHVEILATATVLRFSFPAEAPPHPAIQAVRRYAQILRRHLLREEALVAAASLARQGARLTRPEAPPGE